MYLCSLSCAPRRRNASKSTPPEGRTIFQESPAAIPSLGEEDMIVSNTSSCTEGTNEGDDQESLSKSRRQLPPRQRKVTRKLLE